MKLNNKGVALSSIIYSILILFLILIFGILSILGSRKLLLDKTKNNVLDKLNQEDIVENTNYKDPSGANEPELLDGMVPIMYDTSSGSGKWIVASLENKWYSYGDKEWANAVILNEGVSKNIGEEVTESDIALWYVWIPRFKYTLFNTNGGKYTNCTATSSTNTFPKILVTFEKGIDTTGTVSCIQDLDSTLKKTEICSDLTNNGLIDGVSTYTHPAFTLGDKELTGFWIGKFEISGTTSKINILPNKEPLNSVVNSLFNAVKNISSSYNINGDSHMIRNIEWGAVAYLKQSDYGLGITDIARNATSYTGYANSKSTTYYYSSTNGVKASTTGTIYGVYDMAGGFYEYTMGTIESTSFDKKYVDMYNSNNLNRLGDAVIETKSFYSDYVQSFDSTRKWYVRGGYYGASSSYNGVFAYHGSSSNSSLSSYYMTTRAVLTK